MTSYQIPPSLPWRRLFLSSACALLSLGLSAVLASRAVAQEVDSKDVLELNPFQVSASQSGYKVSAATAATRTNTPIIDIPQSVHVVSKEFLADVGAISQEDAMTYVGNVFTRNARQGPGRFIVRGFETNTALYLDGFGTSSYKRDMAGYERIEVVKGPPSAVQGRGGDSGLINFISKKPELAQAFGELKVQVGSDDMRRVVFDGNLPWKNRDDVAVRVVGVAEESGDFIDDYESKKLVLFPSLRWKLSDRTEFTFFSEVNQSETPSVDTGHGPAYWAREIREKIDYLNQPGDAINALDIPIGRNYLGPGSTRDDFVFLGVARLTHQFSDWLQGQVGYQHLTQDYFEFRYFLEQNLPVAHPQGLPGVWMGPVTTSGTDEQNRADRLQGDLFANYALPGSLSGMEMVTMVGFEYRKTGSDSITRRGAVLAPKNYINLAAPYPQSFVDGYLDGASVEINGSTASTETVKGIYVSQDVKLWKGRVILTAGARRDFSEREVQNRRTLTTSRTDDAVTSQRYGVTWKILPRLSAYAVYSDQPDPKSSRFEWSRLAADDPRSNDMITVSPATELKEVGLKGELWGGRISAQAAYFEMTRLGNVLTITTPTESGGGIVSAVHTSLADSTIKGYELELFGALTDKVSVVANFSRNQSHETAVQNGVLVERPVQRVVDWNANAFVKWDLRKVKSRGLVLRAGVNSFGPFTLGSFGIRDRVEERFVRCDVGASWQQGRSSYDLLVKNVFDEATFIMRLDPMRQVVFTYSYKL
jgi:iron complex outermembrane receptor protein